MKNFRFPLFVFLMGIVLLAASCGEKSIEKSEGQKALSLDSAKSNLVNVSGELFSIPSPIQTALLIQESGAEYKPELLNDSKGYSEYETNTQKAMNLGIYGTDMAYSSLYEDSQKALSYFKAIDNLAKDLGVISAISPDLVKRLGANADNPDSLVYLIGRFYEEGDAYLKKNERYDIASLVILGGWIESSHLSAQSATGGNQAARDRVAQQKESSSTIVKALDKTADRNFKKSDLYQVLDSIQEAFASVQSSYSFEQPQTDAAKKLTVIKSKTDYQVSDSLLNSIAALLESARTKITEK
ncbi:hypothetical protein O3Q51_10395 [Cryomorphaceae bacterium 1068]|nr:hypothetical protein [Cryomorphaceae bacterium 1068]